MTLFPGTIPNEIKLLVKALNKVDTDLYKDIFQVVLKSLTGKMPRQAYEKIFDRVPETQRKTLIALTAGLISLLKSIAKVPEHHRKPESLKADLEELKFPADAVIDILDTTFKHGQIPVPAPQPRLPTIKEFHWRVDVSISTSSLSRVLEPTIMVQLLLSDGSAKTFEMRMKKFHLLRCSISTVLKEMESLEKRQVVKMIEQ